MSAPVISKGGDDGAKPGSAVPGGVGGQAGGRRKTAWMAHVKATMRAHKGLKLKQVLKLAKKTYKKTMRGGGSAGGGVAGGTSPSPISGGRRRRGTRRSRRGGYDM